MNTARNIDDETDFELKKTALNGWMSTANNHSIGTNSFLVTLFSKSQLPDGTIQASTDIRKTFDKPFNRNQVQIKFDIRGWSYEPLKLFAVYFFDDEIDNSVIISAPEMNGEWHTVTAEITPKKDDLRTLLFTISASEINIGSQLQFDNISVLQS